MLIVTVCCCDVRGCDSHWDVGDDRWQPGAGFFWGGKVQNCVQTGVPALAHNLLGGWNSVVLLLFCYMVCISSENYVPLNMHFHTKKFRQSWFLLFISPAHLLEHAENSNSQNVKAMHICTGQKSLSAHICQISLACNMKSFFNALAPGKFRYSSGTGSRA